MIHTGRNSTAKESHFLKGGSRINLNDACRIQHRVLAEGWSVEKMEDRLPVFRRKPALPVLHHRALKWVHPILLAQIGLLGFAVAALFTFSIENWNHMIPFLQIAHPFSHAFHHSLISHPKKISHQNPINKKLYMHTYIFGEERKS